MRSEGVLVSEYATYKGRPVKKVRSVADVQEVRLFDGNLIFAKSLEMQDIDEAEYKRLVKEEQSEKDRLSKKEGFGAPEILYKGSGFTNAQSARGR